MPKDKEPAKGSDYRKLANIIKDLDQIEKDMGSAETNIKRGEEMKGFDDFQKAKAELNYFLADLSKEMNVLDEMKKSTADGQRDTNQIKMMGENAKKLKKGTDMWNALKKQLAEDEKRFEKGKLKGMEAKDMEERAKSLQLLGDEIVHLANRNSRVRPISDSISDPTLRERREARRERKKERQRARAERRRKRGKSSAGEEDDKDSDEDGEPKAMSQEEQEFMKKHEENLADQDELLSEIEKGVDELKQISISIGRNLKTQEAMLKEADEKIDRNIEKVKNANARLAEIVEASGGMTRWCPILICLVVLIALVGYIFNIVG